MPTAPLSQRSNSAFCPPPERLVDSASDGPHTDALTAHGPGLVEPFVQEDGHTRSLHFTRGELQSRMDKRQPWSLAVDYTRTMMAFLLLLPEPASIAMIGLGGGSLAKFCYRHLPDCRITHHSR